MNFFRFVFKQKDKSIGYAFLYSMILGLIFSLSIMIIVLRGYFSIGSSKFVDEYNETLGCEIINYELTCNENFYRYDYLIIKLDYDEETSGQPYGDFFILTKDKVYMETGNYTYEQIFERVGYESNDLDITQIKGFITPMIFAISVIILIISLIIATIGYIIANTVLAFVMGFLLRTYHKVYLDYDQMYKITMFVVTPYVLFNALTRIIFYESMSGFISSQIPFVGGIVHILIDYLIIYGLIYLTAVKSQQNSDSNESISS